MKDGALIATMAPGRRSKVGRAIWYRALSRIVYRVGREVFDKEAYIFSKDMAIFDRGDGATREHTAALMAGANGPLPLIRDRGRAARRPRLLERARCPYRRRAVYNSGHFRN